MTWPSPTSTATESPTSSARSRASRPSRCAHNTTRIPGVSTGDAQPSAYAATVGAAVNPDGSATTYRIDYGTTASYGHATAALPAGGVLTGTANQQVSGALSGLTPLTTYHYRVVATNAVGTTYGRDRTFRTTVVPPSVSSGSRHHRHSARRVGAQLRTGLLDRRRELRVRVAARRVTGRLGQHLHAGAGRRRPRAPVPRHRDQRRRLDRGDQRPGRRDRRAAPRRASCRLCAAGRSRARRLCSPPPAASSARSSASTRRSSAAA